MNAVLPPSMLGRGRTSAELLMAVVQGNGVISLEGDSEASRAAVLDRVAVELAELRVRRLHLHRPASGRLGLAELTTQIAGQVAPDAPPGEGLELAFEALTTPGDGCSRIVLLVADADALLPPAIRYIELACQRCPGLRVVLAGPPGFLDGLDRGGISRLRQRVTRRLHLAGPSDRTASPASPSLITPDPAPNATPEPAAPSHPAAADEAPTLVELARANRDNAWSLAGVGIAASLLLATWSVNWSEALTGAVGASRSPGGAAVVASAEPAAPALPAGVSVEPVPAASRADELSVALTPLPDDASGAPGLPSTEADLPLPPIPPAPGKAFKAVPQAPRPARNANERLVSVSQPQADWARCREIVLMIQVGERLTSAEQRFLRDGCKVR